jgi:FAD/FMN-containing dehydrogenase
MMSQGFKVMYVTRRCNSTPHRSLSVVQDLRKIIGNEHILTKTENPHDITSYTEDWTKSFRGGDIVCFPQNTQQVSDILKYAYLNNIKVVPQSGNTSLSGGSVPIKDEIIVNLKRMSAILEVDTKNAVLVAESGCILEYLSNEVGKLNFIIPLDLGAKGSCMIGGNVATNAGGLRLIKYGSLHHNVLGLEVVLADGSVLNMLKTLRKDNSGYPLKHVFIGSEGSLGIITKVALQLAQKPSATAVVLMRVTSFDSVTQLLIQCRTEAGDIVSAFEYMDSASISSVKLMAPTIFNKLNTLTSL